MGYRTVPDRGHQGWDRPGCGAWLRIYGYKAGGRWNFCKTILWGSVLPSIHCGTLRYHYTRGWRGAPLCTGVPWPAVPGHPSDLWGRKQRGACGGSRERPADRRHTWTALLWGKYQFRAQVLPGCKTGGRHFRWHHNRAGGAHFLLPQCGTFPGTFIFRD